MAVECCPAWVVRGRSAICAQAVHTNIVNVKRTLTGYPETLPDGDAAPLVACWAGSLAHSLIRNAFGDPSSLLSQIRWMAIRSVSAQSRYGRLPADAGSTMLMN
jgi:hypothetical protein